MIENRFRYVYIEAGYKHGDAGEVAKKIGVSRATMSLLMNRDNYKPDLETALLASKFFGKYVEEIWVLTQKEPTPD